MGIHSTTIAKLEDAELCSKIMAKLKIGYSKRYIQTTFKVTKQQLKQIIAFNTK